MGDVGGDGEDLDFIIKIMGSLMRGVIFCNLSSRKISFCFCFYLVRSHLPFKFIFRTHFSQRSHPLRFPGDFV